MYEKYTTGLCKHCGYTGTRLLRVEEFDSCNIVKYTMCACEQCGERFVLATAYTYDRDEDGHIETVDFDEHLISVEEYMDRFSVKYNLGCLKCRQHVVRMEVSEYGVPYEVWSCKFHDMGLPIEYDPKPNACPYWAPILEVE